MNIRKTREMGATANPNQAIIEEKMKIKLSRTVATMCPARILANKRTIKTNGLMNTPINSTRGMIGMGNFKNVGIPGGLTICFQ